MVDVLYELVEDATEADPDAFLDAYLSSLSAVVEQAGRERAVESGVDEATVDAVLSGERTDLTVTDASRLLALDNSFPDWETVRNETLDHILLGMTTAILDVDTVAANLSLDVTATEIQQRIEGRAEMTLTEYAHIHALLVDRQS